MVLGSWIMLMVPESQPFIKFMKIRLFLRRIKRQVSFNFFGGLRRVSKSSTRLKQRSSSSSRQLVSIVVFQVHSKVIQLYIYMYLFFFKQMTIFYVFRIGQVKTSLIFQNTCKKNGFVFFFKNSNQPKNTQAVQTRTNEDLYYGLYPQLTQEG